MLRRLRDSRPTDKASSAENRRLVMELLSCLLNPEEYRARKERAELERKLAVISEWDSPKGSRIVGSCQLTSKKKE